MERLAGRSASELRKAAVNGDLAGGHEAAVRRREKGGHRPDLRRIGHALERIERGEELHALLAQRCLREIGRSPPGRQHVYPDAGALQVLRPGPREVAHCRLARAVGAHCRGARGAGARSGQDDRTALAHQRQRLLDREDRTLHIGVEGFVIDETFDTNVKGTIFTVQKALPLMGQGGSIILTGSSAGTTGAPGMSAYSASKAAVRNLARTWAEDLKGTGIRVNVLSPGATATELAKEALGEQGQKVYASMTPLQRMADPAEIGAVAAFLASSDSSFMTASEVAVDGGLAQL